MKSIMGWGGNLNDIEMKGETDLNTDLLLVAMVTKIGVDKGSSPGDPTSEGGKWAPV